MPEIVQALSDLDSDWARDCLNTLRQRSPLMLHVVLEQIHRARHMTLANDLRMERNSGAPLFLYRASGSIGAQSETVEGIRALAIDKDHSPQWNPSRIEDITEEMVRLSLPAPGQISSTPWPI